MPFKDFILNLIFIPTCFYCESLGYHICHKCQKNLTYCDFPMCIVCESLTINGITHKYCKNENPYNPDSYNYTYIYNTLAKKLIIYTKGSYGGYSKLKYFLDYKNFYTLLENFEIEVFVPIPPSVKSNRLQDITLYIAQNLNIKKLPIKSVLREKNVKIQKNLSREDRFKNATNKYEFISKYKNIIKGKNILIIDDVSTTGASLLNASKLLKEQGAKTVHCYTLCKDLRYNIQNA